MILVKSNHGISARRCNRVVDVRALIWFTCLFALAICLMYGALFASGKTLIRVTDGLDQHYPFFVYIGKWIRGSIAGLFTGAGLPAVWDMSFGYGADMYTSLCAYIFDPFNWLSALVPTRHAETAFVATVVLRLWFAGFTFLVFCRYKQYDTHISVLGALLYATCGVTLVAPVETFFVNPLIAFPLVMRGMHEVMDGKSPVLFICSLAATFIVYFYFGYMTCILLVPAFVAEAVGRRERPHRSLRLFFTFVLYSVVALGISAFIVLPVAMVLMQTGRLGIERPLDALYSVGFYQRTLAGFAGYASVGPDSYIGFSSAGLMATVLLFAQKGNRSLKILFVCYTIILLVPVLGKALNGFAYVTNRWVWAYAFVVAHIAVLSLPSAVSISRKRLYIVVSVGLAYIAFLLWMALGNGASGTALYSFLITATTAGVLLVAVFLLRRDRGGIDSREHSGRWLSVCMACIVVCSGSSATMLFLKPSMPQLDAGKALEEQTTGSAYQVLLDSVPFDRAGCSWRAENLCGDPYSSALMNRVYSYDYYISVYNDRVDELHTLLGLNGTHENVHYKSLNSRAGLDFAFGSRYYLCGGSSGMVPYGYVDVGGNDKTRIFESPIYRPIASLCDRVVSVDAFMAANMAEREALLATSVVINNGTQVTAALPEIEFRTVPGDGVSLNGGDVSVDKKDEYVELRFRSDGKSACYLELEECSFSPVPDSTGRTVAFSDAKGNRIASLYLMSPKHHMTGGKVTCTGTLPEGEQVVRAKFSHAGTYSFSRAHMVCLPDSLLDDARSTVRMQDVEMSSSNNRIACRVTSDKDQTLLVTTPWSAGWRATVDGAPVVIEQADIAFMGIPVSAGEHEVVLEYRTPGLVVGLLISICGISATVFIAARRRSTRVGEATGDAEALGDETRR